MSDESGPVEYDDAGPDLDEVLQRRREELLAKVREVNKRSLTGPDSPTLHLHRNEGC